MTEFLHMGGYAFYVWTSYGIALVILAANIILPMRLHRSLLRKIALKMKREGIQREAHSK